MNNANTDLKEFIKAVKLLAKQEGSGTNIKYSVINGVITSTSAGVGLLFGGIGFVVGAAVGTGIAAKFSHKKYKSMYEIILSLKQNEQKLVFDAFKNAITKAAVIARFATTLSMAANGDPAALKDVARFVAEAYQICREDLNLSSY